MNRPARIALAALLIAGPVAIAGQFDRPIPQDPAKQERKARELGAWQRRTLAGAYEAVGKRDPRWDGPAREALEAAARYFSHEIEPIPTVEAIHDPAKRALAAGCDDPLILYLYARSSYVPNYPGRDEAGRRYLAAAAAMEPSDYPPIRKVIALAKGGATWAWRDDATAVQRQEAGRLFDAALALAPGAVAAGGRVIEAEDQWFETFKEILAGQRRLTGDFAPAAEKVDGALAKVPELDVMRLQLKGAALIDAAGEARGVGLADTVTDEGWRKFKERLTQAKDVLERSWTLRPSGRRTPDLMLSVVNGLDGDRDEMEKWFARAMEADGDDVEACILKMDYLDPKWHGSREEVLAFGQACRATKNWRAGITLLAADAHQRVAGQMTPQEYRAYKKSEPVWGEIRAVYEEYLGHYPEDYSRRSDYATHCCFCGQFAKSDEEFKRVGDKLIGSRLFPEATMRQCRSYAAAWVRKAEQAKGRPGAAGGGDRPKD